MNEKLNINKRKITYKQKYISILNKDFLKK